VCSLASFELTATWHGPTFTHVTRVNSRNGVEQV